MAKKKVFKKQKKHIIFDEKERTEYLTGFRKRNIDKKLKAKEKLDNLLKEEKKRIKKSQKEAIHQALTSTNQVPEIEHLLKPVTYDLPDHTVTISEFENWNNSSVPVTSSLHSTQDDLKLPSKNKKEEDEVEKIRKLINDLKSKRIKTIQSSAAQLAAKRRQRKKDRAKAKKTLKLLSKTASKHTKKKHKKKK